MENKRKYNQRDNVMGWFVCIAMGKQLVQEYTKNMSFSKWEEMALAVQCLILMKSLKFIGSISHFTKPKKQKAPPTATAFIFNLTFLLIPWLPIHPSL